MSSVTTNRELQELLKAATSDPSANVLVMEDVDVTAPFMLQRSSTISLTTLASHDSLDGPPTLEQMLNFLDGTLCRDGMVVVLTTNRLEVLDPALVRDGRMDVKLELKRCDRYQCCAMFKRMVGRELDPEVALKFVEYAVTPATFIGHVAGRLADGLTDEEMLAPFLERAKPESKTSE